MIVPDEARRILQQVVPDDASWENIDLQFSSRLPESQISGRCPYAIIPMGVVFVTRRAYGTATRALRTVGMTIGRTIYLAIHPRDLRTAAGLALLAHEKVHVNQYATIPNFQDLYTQMAYQTPAGQPWRNPYEEQAYRVEARVYCQLVAAGYPRGKWVPLGISVWGCNA